MELYGLVIDAWLIIFSVISLLIGLGINWTSKQQLRMANTELMQALDKEKAETSKLRSCLNLITSNLGGAREHIKDLEYALELAEAFRLRFRKRRLNLSAIVEPTNDSIIIELPNGKEFLPVEILCREDSVIIVSDDERFECEIPLIRAEDPLQMADIIIGLLKTRALYAEYFTSDEPEEEEPNS